MAKYTHTSEKEFVKQFEATFVKDKERQYQDIDAEKVIQWTDKEGNKKRALNTYSLKYQSLAKPYQMFSFENKLIDSRTGEFVLGNFPKCKATHCVISDGDHWFFYRCADLKAFMRENAHLYERKNLTYQARMNNRSYGRKYDDAENILVPIADLEHLLRAKVPHMKRFPKDYKLTK